MTTEDKGVETVVDAAPTQPEVDYEAVLAQKDAELAKVREEKDNYRKGLLKAKGKIPDVSSDNDGIEDAESMTRRIVQETLLSTKEAQLQADKDNALKAVLKRNKELELALKNRGQVTDTSSQGSNQEKPEGKKDNTLSNEQLNGLKSKGWSDKKIEEFKKNLSKGTQIPK